MSDDRTTRNDNEPSVPFAEIRRRGELVLEQMKQLNPALDYNEASIEWLDGYIRRNHHTLTEEHLYSWAVAFGYILGETMVRTFGGTWVYKNEWSVFIESLEANAYPIHMADEYLLGHSEDMYSKFCLTRMLIIRGGMNSFLKEAEVGPSGFYEIRPRKAGDSGGDK
jgi:hypothetical protein